MPADLLIAADRMPGALARLAVALFGCAVLGGLAALVFWPAVRPDRDRSQNLGGVPSP
jgi:hypothetical protein